MTLPSGLDPRLTPARPDLAADFLRGRVEAERFVAGRPGTVTAELLDMRGRPRADASLTTQLLHGEAVTVYEEDEGWAWVQAERDGYVGYVAAAALGRADEAPTHRVVVNRTFVYPAPDMKQPILRALPLDGRVAARAGTRAGSGTGAFVALAGGGYIYASHLAALERPVSARAVSDRLVSDYVAVAEGLIGAPYLWGGKSVAGIDCSGLVQLAASLAGWNLPRDSDLQQKDAALAPIEPSGDELRRGDLAFWTGHVGILVDGATLLHANGYHMLVIREAFSAAQARIAAASGGQPAVIKRLIR